MGKFFKEGLGYSRGAETPGSGEEGKLVVVGGMGGGL